MGSNAVPRTLRSFDKAAQPQPVPRTTSKEIEGTSPCRPPNTALLLLDVDGFKHINDNFGHAVGDECIRQIARRLKRICGKTDNLVARLGGDEFAAIIAPESALSVEDIAKCMLEAVRRPIRTRKQSFQLSTSIGIAYSDGAASSPLLAKADLALYAAKALGGNMFEVFTPSMKEAADRRFNTVRSITAALDGKELELFYQPKINLGTGALAGFEVLLRWRKKRRFRCRGRRFRRCACQTQNFPFALTAGSLRTPCCRRSDGRPRGLAFGHIAVNLGARQFLDPEFGRKLIRRVAQLGLEPSSIEVEVTEGVLLNQKHGAVQEILQAFRAGGIKIALDDFGTGYASLTHLKMFPVDILKIDRSFVQDFLTSRTGNAVLQSMLFLARQMDLEVVAEGIEEHAQLEYLKALGCRYGQGYLFSKAVPASEAARNWLADEAAAA